jgi:hypothetical protein
MTKMGNQNLIGRLIYAFENIIYFCAYIFVIVVVNHRLFKTKKKRNNHRVMPPLSTKFRVIKLYSHWSRIAIIS